MVTSRPAAARTGTSRDPRTPAPQATKTLTPGSPLISRRGLPVGTIHAPSAGDSDAPRDPRAARKRPPEPLQRSSKTDSGAASTRPQPRGSSTHKRQDGLSLDCGVRDLAATGIAAVVVGPGGLHRVAAGGQGNVLSRALSG